MYKYVVGGFYKLALVKLNISQILRHYLNLFEFNSLKLFVSLNGICSTRLKRVRFKVSRKLPKQGLFLFLFKFHGFSKKDRSEYRNH